MRKMRIPSSSGPRPRRHLIREGQFLINILIFNPLPIPLILFRGAAGPLLQAVSPEPGLATAGRHRQLPFPDTCSAPGGSHSQDGWEPALQPAQCKPGWPLQTGVHFINPEPQLSPLALVLLALRGFFKEMMSFLAQLSPSITFQPMVNSAATPNISRQS